MQHYKYDLKVLVVLRAIRELRCLSQHYMSVLLGTDRSVYSRLENGKVTITPGKLVEIAIVLKTTAQAILAIASVIDQIKFDDESIGLKIQKALGSLSLEGGEKIDFTSTELRIIFMNVKRYYPKMILDNIQYSQS